MKIDRSDLYMSDGIATYKYSDGEWETLEIINQSIVGEVFEAKFTLKEVTDEKTNLQ